MIGSRQDIIRDTVPDFPVSGLRKSALKPSLIGLSNPFKLGFQRPYPPDRPLDLDFDFALHKLLGGAMPRGFKLQIGEVPLPVSLHYRTHARAVYLSTCDAQKILHHPKHGMSIDHARMIASVVANGDYYQQTHRGCDREVCCVLHEKDRPQRCYFLVLAHDKAGRGWHFRTFFRNTAMTRNKFKGAVRLFHPSRIDYFKLGE